MSTTSWPQHHRIRDGVGFHADTTEGLRNAFCVAVEDHIEVLSK